MAAGAQWKAAACHAGSMPCCCGSVAAVSVNLCSWNQPAENGMQYQRLVVARDFDVGHNQSDALNNGMAT